MAKQHLTDEELERDEVAESLSGGVDWAREHSRQLLFMAIAVLIALILGLSIRGYSSAQSRDANAALAQAITNWERLDSISDEKAAKESEEQILQSLNSIIDNHGSMALANEARFLKGKLEFRRGEYEKARQLFAQYTEKARDSQLKAQGEIATAYAFENESFLTTDTARQRSLLGEALTAYQHAQQTSPAPSFLFYYARMGQARYHELIGELPQAIEIYEQVMKDRPAPVAAEDETQKGDHEGDSQIALLRNELKRMEKTFSLAETARLRLDRLRAQTASTSQTQTTVVTTTP